MLLFMKGLTHAQVRLKNYSKTTCTPEELPRRLFFAKAEPSPSWEPSPQEERLICPGIPHRKPEGPLSSIYLGAGSPCCRSQAKEAPCSHQV